MESVKTQAEAQLESPSNVQESSENPVAEAKSFKDSSGISPVETARENGARVSLNGKEDIAVSNGARVSLNGKEDIAVSELADNVASSQVPAAAMGDRSDVMLGEKEGVLEDSEMNGVPSLLTMEDSKGLHGLGPVIDDNEKNESNSRSGVRPVTDVCEDVNFSDAKVDEDNEQSDNEEHEMEEEVNSGDGEHEYTVADFSSVLYEPVELLTELKDAAQEATAISMLEFTVLKSWLSAFYSAKGGYRLPCYYDPMLVPGLEDKSRDRTDDIEFQVHGPEEKDRILSPRGRKYSQTTQSQRFGHNQRKKQKSITEILEGDKKSSQATSSTKRKKRKCMGEDAADDAEISLYQFMRIYKKRNSNLKDNEEMKENLNSAKKVDGIESSKGMAKEILREESFSRKRKKSKYLSPPYTNIYTGPVKKDRVAKYSKVSSEGQLGDKLTNRSPRIQLSVDLSPNQSRVGTIDPTLVKAPTNEVLYMIRDAALNPLYLDDTNSVDEVEQFFSAFRNSSYCSETNEPKENQDAILSLKDTTDTGASLIVAFGPGSSLPSKKEVIEIYGKFGALNEKETDMFYTNYCARVVFLKSSEAEEAFKLSQLSSPFGAANVTFRLRYQSETKTHKLREISSHKPSATTAENMSELNFMKEKLEGILSLVEKSGGKIFADLKSTLEGEIKVVLEKVSAIMKSS